MQQTHPGQVLLYGTATPQNLATAEPSPHLTIPDDVLVNRAFGFVDICKFSTYTAQAGPPAAFEALRRFRSLVRVVASTRGVRIASWLGDGAMLVGVDPAPVAATVVELVARSERPLRGSCTQGLVLLFEGDDHIGASVNLASRLCEAAEPGQVLAPESATVGLPGWVDVTDLGPRELRGLGEEHVYALGMDLVLAESLRDGFPTGQMPAIGTVAAPL
jgi:class 3 adenylate cyclase